MVTRRIMGGGRSVAPTGEDCFEVAAKYLPKRDADKFFVLLRGDRGRETKVMFPNREYSRFDVLDVLEFDEYDSTNDWLRYWGDFQVHSVQVQAQEVVVDIGYMSIPRRVATEYYFLTRLANGGKWMLIPYSVASEHFVGGTGPARTGDYYQLLGLAPNATPAEIRTAYRKAARTYHPDVNPDSDLMTGINVAYEVLSDEESRQAYDVMSRVGRVDADRLAVRKWPGSGAGKLTALVEERGDTWLVRQVLGFERNKQVRENEIPVSGLTFTNNGVRVYLEDLSQYLWFDREDLPFEPSAVLDEVKAELPGTLRYSITSVQRASFDAMARQPRFRWQVRDQTLVWSDDLVEALQHYLADHRYASALRAALSAARARIASEGVVMDLGEVAREHEVTLEDLESSLWRPEYDPQYAAFLAEESMDRRWGYTLDFLVFRYANDVVVFERPEHGAATYVFRLQGEVTVGSLAGHFAVVNKLELRRTPEIQRVMGYLGFAIHREVDSWRRKVQELIFSGNYVGRL